MGRRSACLGVDTDGTNLTIVTITELLRSSLYLKQIVKSMSCTVSLLTPSMFGNELRVVSNALLYEKQHLKVMKLNKVLLFWERK